MLDTLTVNEQGTDVTELMENLTVSKGGNEDDEKVDMSYWEELEILNEEYFSSPEEQEIIATAERGLMNMFKESVEEEVQQENILPDKTKPTNIMDMNGEGNSSLEEDKLPAGSNPLEDEVPAGSSPLDNLLNRVLQDDECEEQPRVQHHTTPVVRNTPSPTKAPKMTPSTEKRMTPKKKTAEKTQDQLQLWKKRQ